MQTGRADVEGVPRTAALAAIKVYVPAEAGGVVGLRRKWLVVLLLLSGCGAARSRADGLFWLRAQGDAQIRVLPTIDAGAPGVTVHRQFKGTVADHAAAGGAAVDAVLTLRQASGDVRLYYRVGANRRLPVKIGDLVRIEMFMRRHAEGDESDAGMLVYKLVATASFALGGAPAALAVQDVLVAVVENQDIIGRELVPPPLRMLRATDVAAYHESGTYSGDCEEIRAHQNFRIGEPEWVTLADGTPRPGRFAAPGSRLIIDDGRDRFDVVLLDNRRTESSTCRIAPEPTWSWAAIRNERPAQQNSLNKAASDAEKVARPTGDGGGASRQQLPSR